MDAEAEGFTVELRREKKANTSRMQSTLTCEKRIVLMDGKRQNIHN